MEGVWSEKERCGKVCVCGRERGGGEEREREREREITQIQQTVWS